MDIICQKSESDWKDKHVLDREDTVPSLEELHVQDCRRVHAWLSLWLSELPGDHEIVEPSVTSSRQCGNRKGGTIWRVLRSPGLFSESAFWRRCSEKTGVRGPLSGASRCASLWAAVEMDDER